MKYVIEKKDYDRHIEDKVRLFTLLHQLADQARKVKDDIEMEELILTAMRCGTIADEMFSRWDIPGRYLAFGDKKALVKLYARELVPLSEVLDEHDMEQLALAVEGASGDQAYLISGASFRLLVTDIFRILSIYGSQCRHVQEYVTEKGRQRLEGEMRHDEQTIRHIFRRWGVEGDSGVTDMEMLQRAIEKKHLIPVPEDEPEGACLDMPEYGEPVF